MYVPSLHKIPESVFELSGTQVKTYGGGGSSKTDMKPAYARFSSEDYKISAFHKIVINLFNCCSSLRSIGKLKAEQKLGSKLNTLLKVPLLGPDIKDK